jgi:hypothetical protein
VPPSQLGAGHGPAVKDSRAPLARISGPRDGKTYRRGPRLLRGIASDAESGVAQVKLAFRRHVHGRCRWWSGRRERFVGSNCHKKFFFAIGEDARWSYLLPRALPAGRYVLDVKAFDRAQNRDERFERGRNRVVFYVRPPRRRAAASTRAPAVRVMVSGRSFDYTQLERPHSVTVRTARRSCKVAAATPLAALVSLLRDAHRHFRLRDYGHCSRDNPASSAQLFVTQVGRDRNRGNDGWFYKIDDRAGTAGAGDPFGQRLRAGDRVLWFYCRFDTRVRSCQRSLQALVTTRRVMAGASLRARVRSFDNDGHARPEPGVTVTLAGASAVSDTVGAANLTAPRAGRFFLEATKPRTTPAFPVPLTIIGPSG